DGDRAGGPDECDGGRAGRPDLGRPDEGDRGAGAEEGLRGDREVQGRQRAARPEDGRRGRGRDVEGVPEATRRRQEGRVGGSSRGHGTRLPAGPIGSPWVACLPVFASSHATNRDFSDRVMPVGRHSLPSSNVTMRMSPRLPSLEAYGRSSTARTLSCGWNV